MQKIIIVKNICGGPWKIKFIPGTPDVIKKQIKGVLSTGQTIRIDEKLSKFIDMGHLTVSRNRKAIAFKVYEFDNKTVPVTKKTGAKKPKRKSQTSKKKVAKKKKEKKTSEPLVTEPVIDKEEVTDDLPEKDGGN